MARISQKSIEYRVGLFLLIPLTILALTLLTVGVKRNLFSPKIDLQIYATTGEGLSVGMPLLFSGFTIATVHSISLRGQEQIVLKTRIPKSYLQWVKVDSQMRQGVTLLGTSYIEVLGGSVSAITPEDNTLYILNQEDSLVDITKTISPLLRDAGDIISNIKEITGELSDQDSDFNQFIAGLGVIGQDLTAETGSIGYFVRSNEFRISVSNIVDNITKITSTLDSTILALESIASDTAESAPVILSQIENASIYLTPILSEVDALLFESTILVDALQNSWLVSAPSNPNTQIQSISLD